ncbi:TOBE domain-containing protein [Calothrix sp. NIES-4101]|nr:TOBE domain-containing protein [Calothrix sp. NIES-4101]
MKISARNSFKGTVKKVTPGAINTEIVLEIAPSIEVTSIITKSSADNLNLVVGKEAYVMVKSSDVLIAVD